MSHPVEEVCHLGIVCALGIEADELVRRLSGVVRIEGAGFVAREGGLSGRRLLVCESGVGQRAAERATEQLLLGHRPRWVMSMGFAGGLDPQIAAGELLLANSVVNEQQQELACYVPEHVGEIRSRRPVHQGRLLSVDRVVGDPADKRRLGAAHRALAVDMEAFAVANACQRAGTPLIALRAITDDVDRSLPRDIANLARQRSTAGRIGAVAGAIFRRPSSIKELWRLKEQAYLAAEVLADFIVQLVERLA